MFYLNCLAIKHNDLQKATLSVDPLSAKQQPISRIAKLSFICWLCWPFVEINHISPWFQPWEPRRIFRPYRLYKVSTYYRHYHRFSSLKKLRSDLCFSLHTRSVYFQYRYSITPCLHLKHGKKQFLPRAHQLRLGPQTTASAENQSCDPRRFLNGTARL